MKNKTTEELIVQWMDGDSLSAEEQTALDRIKKEDPEMMLNPEEFSVIQGQLKEVFSQEQDIPHADLFMNSFQNRIERENYQQKEVESLQEKVISLTQLKEAEVEDPKPSLPETDFRKFSWLQIGSAMAACIMVGLFLGNALIGSKKGPEIVEVPVITPTMQLTPVVYTADQSLSADFRKQEQSNVIVIEGLEAIPDDFDLFSLAKEKSPIKVKPTITLPE